MKLSNAKEDQALKTAEEYWRACLRWLSAIDVGELGLVRGSEVTMLLLRPGRRVVLKIGNVRAVKLPDESTFDGDVLGRNIFCLIADRVHISEDGLIAIRRRLLSRFKGLNLLIRPGIMLFE